MTAVASRIETGPRLPAYALFAGVLSAAGLPIYIHAPKFYVDEYGVSLAALGALLFALTWCRTRCWGVSPLRCAHIAPGRSGWPVW